MSEIATNYRAVVAGKFPERDSKLVNEQIDEVCKYLEIVSEASGPRFIPLTQDADEVWHEMIVQTALYAEFCRQLPSGRFVHHESIGMDDYAAREGMRKTVAQYLEWVPEYTSRFGPFTESTARHWSVVEFLQCELGMTLAEVNALQFEQAA